MKNSYHAFLFWLISIVFLVLLLTTCKDDKFELDRLSDDMELSPSFSAPLARGSITLKDMVDDGENIVLDSSETYPYLKIIHREDSIFTFEGNDLFEVNESGEESYTLGNIEIGSFGPISEIITLRNIVDNAVTNETEADMIKDADGQSIEFPEIDESDPMEVGGDYEVDEIDNFRYAGFESGEIEITLTNNMPVEVTAEFQLRTKILDNSGDTDEDLGINHFVFPDIPVGDSHTETFDLSGETLGSVLYASDIAISTPGSNNPVDIDLDQQNLAIDAQSNNLVISSGEVAIPEQTLEDQLTKISTGYSGDRRLDTIKLSGGGMELTIENNTNLSAYLEINLLQSRYTNGDNVSLEQQLSAQSVNHGELDLTDSETILNGTDSLHFGYTIKLDDNEDFVEYHATDEVSFSYNLFLDSDDLEYVSGYFGEDTLGFDENLIETEIGILDNLSGDFTLTDPKLKLFYTNTIGIPFTANPDLIAESGAEQQNLNEGDSDGLIDFKYPARPYNTITDTITIDKNTSDIDKFISLPPQNIRLGGEGYINLDTDPASTQNFITSENRVNVGMEMDLPLELKTTGLTYQDTVGFDMDVDFEETVNLYGIFNNQFPFSIDIKLICRDSTTNRDLLTLEPLDEEGQAVSMLEAPEVNENGRVNAPQKNLVYFKVTGDEIALLNETNQLALEATVKTSQTNEGDFIGVKFYTDYTLDFRLGIDETKTKFNF
ncbi:MAG: hypothetical protein ACLFM7_01615 [Bacteroidales bacterium]